VLNRPCPERRRPVAPRARSGVALPRRRVRPLRPLRRGASAHPGPHHRRRQRPGPAQRHRRAYPGVAALMDFTLASDQEALQEAVRKLCEGRFPMERVRALADVGGVDRGLWRELADAGVFSLRLPEHDGGAGLGMAEAALVLEEPGRTLVPGPLLGTHLAPGV